MAPTLYHVPKTISSPIVQTLLELNLRPCTVKVQVMSFADLKSESHLAINPMGTSPTLQDDDDDTILWESGAVLNYILEEYDTEATLYAAPRTKQRARYLQLQQYIIATVYPFIASLYIHTLGKDQDDAYIESAKSKWRTLLAPTLEQWLGDGPYFLGDKLSAVDFLVAKPLSNVNSLGMLDETPKLKALFESVSSRPSFGLAYGTTPLEPKLCEQAMQPTKRTFSLVPTQ